MIVASSTFAVERLAGVWTAAFVLLLLLEVALVWRTVRAPSEPDRLIAGSLAANVLTFVLLVAALLGGSELYFDAVLAAALLSFSGTIVIAKWISTGEVF
jgi:multisubunit Na+/H+ antiporter MnhF subunit